MLSYTAMLRARAAAVSTSRVVISCDAIACIGRGRRLTSSLMMHGRNNGKKLKAVEIVRNACEIVHLLTDSNPIQVIVDAVINR